MEMVSKGNQKLHKDGDIPLRLTTGSSHQFDNGVAGYKVIAVGGPDELSVRQVNSGISSQTQRTDVNLRCLNLDEPMA